MADKKDVNLDEVIETKVNEDVEEKKNDEELNDKDMKINELEKKLQEKEKECSEYIDLLRISRAEFDNYRKRTNKEKEVMYDDGFADAIKELLPTLDNLERAVESVNDENKTEDGFYQGVELVLKVFKDSLTKSGVEEIKALGEAFDPNFHNAVMHVEDENFGENTVVDVFQKGYIYKNKVIRYSMVKVAN